MNAKTLLALIAIILVSLLSGCATVVPRTAGLDTPATLKSDEYYKTNIKDVITKADNGDAESQFELSYLYSGYRVGNPDIKKSNFWLEKAAAQDYMPAVSSLKIGGTDSDHIFVLNKALKDNKIRCD